MRQRGLIRRAVAAMFTAALFWGCGQAPPEAVTAPSPEVEELETPASLPESAPEQLQAELLRRQLELEMAERASAASRASEPEKMVPAGGAGAPLGNVLEGATPSAPPPPPPAPAPMITAPVAKDGPVLAPRSGPVGSKSAAMEPTSKDYTEVPVYYATDRKRDPAALTDKRFGKERNPEGDHLAYGRAVITIPKHHRVGAIERPQWWKFEFREDPKRHVVMMEPVLMTRELFYQEMGAAASGAPQKELLLFIHGFNVEYAEAMRRTGQIVYDLGFGGVPMCYSWPSQGEFTAYPVDKQNAEWTIPHLVKVLRELQQVESFEKVHIIAHSMGTHVLTKALSEITDPDFHLKLNNVILAAPDIDADIFREQILPKIRGKAQRLTMYASSGDTALNLSMKFNGSRRLGLSGDGLVVVPDLMDTVDASAIDTSLIGHSYYGSQKVVVEDLFKLVIKGLLPEQRSLKHGSIGQWELPLPEPETGTPPAP